MAENIASVSQPKTSIVPDNSEVSWVALGVHNYIKTFIILGLFYCVYQNQIDGIVSRWTSDPSWSHGLLIPFFSLYFLNQHKAEILKLKTKPNYLGLFLLICGLVFYPLNIVHFQYGYLQPLSMVATLGAIVLFLGGWSLVKYMWLPIGYLVFAIPLPQFIYVQITMPMRQWAALVATALLNLVKGIEATVSGVIIDVVYNGQRMEPPIDIAEACSGMRLLMAFVALGVAMAYLHYRPLWQRLILLAATIPIAIFCNIVRVTVSGFIIIFWDAQYAQGIWHDGLGMLMLFLAFGLYGAIAWFMSSLFVEQVNGPRQEDIIVRKPKS